MEVFNINNGYLKLNITCANQAYPINNATVKIYRIENDEVTFEEYLLSNKKGQTKEIALSAPPKNLSLQPENTMRPYTAYSVEIHAKDYCVQKIIGVQIFADQHAILNVNMIPCLNAFLYDPKYDYIADHYLITNESSGIDGQEYSPQKLQQIAAKKEMMSNRKQRNTLPEVIIPVNIRVHLGKPDYEAENITIPFIDYIKNVASSEIYPSWPYECLKANILAQISVALNRIYTEWYPSKGYDFDITNATSHDQAFIKNRNIFREISEIVDDIFNVYLKKAQFVEPLYAQYCDGKNTICPGMRQWETLSLANEGYDALKILQHFYGEDITQETCDNIMEIKESYPGIPLKIGSVSEAVKTIQEQLNAIAMNYPNITPVFPVDGVFRQTTMNAVIEFQKQFDLTADGIVGKQTYYKINYVYIAVRKMSDLRSMGKLNNLYSGEWPRVVYKKGDKGIEIQLAQYYISCISLFYPNIPYATIDGRFGEQFFDTIIAYQQFANLISDGMLGQATWNSIYQTYQSIEKRLAFDEIPLYPGTPIKKGDHGEVVLSIQRALNTVSSQYSSIQAIVCDGSFGNMTFLAVQNFQQQFFLPDNGQVDFDTWVKLFLISQSISIGEHPQIQTPSQFSKQLKLGDRGDDVWLLQTRIKTIAVYYSFVPMIEADGIYGAITKEAVMTLQNHLGLDADGIVGQETWAVINQLYTDLMT